MARIWLLLSFAFLFTSSALAADTADTPAKSATRTRIGVDLRGRSITGTLPFDVRFDLTGPIPETVDRVNLQFAECPRGVCPAIQPDPGGCGVLFPAGVTFRPTKSEAPLAWTRAPVIDQPHGTETAVPFVIGMPMLDAQREYLFVFEVQSRPDPAALQAIRQSVGEMLEEEFGKRAAMPGSRDLTIEQAVAIQKSVIARIKTIAPCARTTGALSESSSAKDVQTFFTPLQLMDVTAKTRMNDDIAKLSNNAARLSKDLQALRGDAMKGALAALDKAPASARNKAVIDDLANLASLSNAQFASVALGADPDHPDTTLQPFSGLLPTTELAARAAALDKLRLSAEKARESLTAIQETSPDTKLPGVAETAAALKRVDNSAFEMAGAARDYVRNAAVRSRQETTLSAMVDSVMKSIFIIGGSSIGDFDTNSSWYLSADPGLAWAPGIEKIVPYIGTNIYFRPVNRDTPLSMRGSFGRRFALSIGLTAATVAEAGKRNDLFGSQALLTGFGYRVTDAIRVGVGGLVFQKEDPNPLISHKRLGAVPYLSMSFDWNVKKLTAGLGSIFPAQ